MQIIDPTPSEKKIKSNYYSKKKSNPSLIEDNLLTCDGRIYFLTRMEKFLIWLGITTIKDIDRYQTRLAKFNILKNRITRRVMKKGRIVPFLYKDPKTLKPILFTSIGIVYKLSYFDRLMLKLGKIDINDIDDKAVGYRIIKSKKSDDHYLLYIGSCYDKYL